MASARRRVPRCVDQRLHVSFQSSHLAQDAGAGSAKGVHGKAAAGRPSSRRFARTTTWKAGTTGSTARPAPGSWTCTSWRKCCMRKPSTSTYKLSSSARTGFDDINGAYTGTCKGVCTSTGRNTLPVTSHLHNSCANAHISWCRRCEQGCSNGEYVGYICPPKIRPS